MRELSRELQVTSLELELRGLEVSLNVKRMAHAQLVQQIGCLETERAELEVKVNDLRNPC